MNGIWLDTVVSPRALSRLVIRQSDCLHKLFTMLEKAGQQEFHQYVLS